MHSWRRRDPAPLAVDHARFLLTMTPVPTSILPTCVLWPPPNILRSNLDHNENPYCTALSILNVWIVGAIERVTSEYRFMVVVPRWCGVYGRYSMHICGTFMNALDLVVSYECMYAGESSTNFICECTLILFADTMKRNFQGVDDDQGSEYLKCSFLRLQKPLSCYL